MKNTKVREVWLTRFVELLVPLFLEQKAKLPAKIRVSCGWPSKAATARSSKRRIGEAWSFKCSADNSHEIFLSPAMDDPIQVGATLVHELVHVAVGVEHGHKAPFRRLAVAVGLTGKMTATTAGDELKTRLHVLSKQLGPYPHAKLQPVEKKEEDKPGSRMIKVECQDCGCVVRMTRKWLDATGAPICGCTGSGEERMQEAG